MSTKNKSIDSLERISDYLRINDIMYFELANIELITIEHSNKYKGIKIKQGLNCDCYSVIANNQLNYNRYLRSLRNEHISKYDGYFELDGKEVVYKDTL